MKPELILHIGLEKTGTTSIQQSLADLRGELLKDEGVLYPSFGGKINHIKLCVYALNTSILHSLHTMYVQGLDEIKSFRLNFEEELAQEIEKSNCERVIMSSEHLSSNLGTIEQIRRLKGLLTPLFSRIKILVYLRRQDQLLLSRYSTQIKAGGFHEFTMSSDIFADTDFGILLDRWSQVFGRDNVDVRWFDRTCFVNGNLLRDFQAATGLKTKLPEQTLNPSLDMVKLSFLKEFNSHYSDLKGKPLRIKRRNLVSILEAVEKLGPKLKLSAKESKEILLKYKASNAGVLKTFASGNGSPDLKPLASGNGLSLKPVDGRQAVKLAHAIWDLRGEAFENLNTRLEKSNTQRRFYRQKLFETENFQYISDLESKLRRQNAQVAFFKAEAYRLRGEYEEAGKTYRQALELFPKNEDYLKNYEENEHLLNLQRARS